MKIFAISLTIALATTSAFGMGSRDTLTSSELNIYSARKEALIKPLLDRFSEATGTQINLVTGKGDALLTRLQSEGLNSPADLLLTVDAGRLYRAQQAGILQPMISKRLNAAIPQHLRSIDDQWFGLSVRARVIVYAKDRVGVEQLSTYEALAEPRWRGKICVRSSSNIYNQSLVASMLATVGMQYTEAWLEGLVANFARTPAGGDRDQIKAVAAGLCDVAIVNSYYLGGMLRSSDPAQLEAASSVGLFWPNQDGRGTHINISGAGVTRSSQNPELAAQLIAFLASDESQRWYAGMNNEFPVRADIEVSETLRTWGGFDADQLNVTELGRNNANAIMAMDRAGWK
jgi:iron(III) transport system substrate-binding protein|tara:strand:+ start:288 stop:1322 length:1035 start_codon:yes stop_codon:yes gene_type:complete